nr:MAG TPA: DNA-directed RNA polymerase [Caudoviricetes sp.]
MAEYIEREALRKVLEVWRDAHADVDDAQGCGLLEDVIWEVDAQPAADVAPVVHGQWEYTPQTFNTLGQIRCPFCAWWSLDQSIDGIYKYCPNCGAKMDGGNS